MNTSHIFDPQPKQSIQMTPHSSIMTKSDSTIPQSESYKNRAKNIKPIKIELKDEKAPTARKNVLKPFINKEREKLEDYKVDIIKNRYHNSSDIFFTKTQTPAMKQQLKNEAFPKKKKYISNYDPEHYLKFHNSFDSKIHDLYHERGDKFLKNRKREKKERGQQPLLL